MLGVEYGVIWVWGVVVRWKGGAVILGGVWWWWSV